MAVFNPWTRHYQAAWENRAANHNLPLWARIFSLAYGRHQANGHAVFGRGELTWILGTPPKASEPFQRASRQAVREAIATAVKHGFLDDDSCSECLVVPGHAIQGPHGKAAAPCLVHERKYRAKRAKLTLVS
ncbi:hypothetical protein [Mycobacterium sp. 852002-51057_SCH5723018]|uniref:hypothetical protein n=1 Tax=Mycobacterium sp. 852002-51057_SCH5723018 TaxID=1834094 RepID=UPI00080067F3|nr:hypothetical protein [Mycobacterium sp. 852002-51057_SCH5723018]OBG28383.1 hypothetical protein A5764_25715 [Mycobacterium sp. 852002-51057_SCH5723018]